MGGAYVFVWYLVQNSNFLHPIGAAKDYSSFLQREIGECEGIFGEDAGLNKDIFCHRPPHTRLSVIIRTITADSLSSPCVSAVLLLLRTDSCEAVATGREQI